MGEEPWSVPSEHWGPSPPGPQCPHLNMVSHLPEGVVPLMKFIMVSALGWMGSGGLSGGYAGMSLVQVPELCP